MEKSEVHQSYLEPSLYTQNLYVPLYLIIINSERGYIHSRRPLNKPLIVSNNFRGL